MSSQALTLARLQAGNGTAEDKVLALVAQRTRLYVWAWRLAVAGGLGFALLVALATIH
jgi:hypothetical protein